jgi:acyl-phosphate glycerol 3-phosphate acyltransferase
MLVLSVVVAYLIGAIPFGYLIARARGVDILREGSGNIGATNVGRVLGRRFGILVFLLDFAKGAIPTAIAGRLADTDVLPDLLPAAVGLAAFLGHLFPIYLRFKGGKGVATGAGVVAVLLPGPAGGALFVWAAVLIATRYVSLASLAAAATLVLLRLGLVESPFAENHVVLSVFCLVAAGLIAVRHRANIGRLIRGNENRLRESSPMLLFVKTVHVLTLGLWFGSTIFFSFVVGLSLFRTFGELSEKDQRPFWLPIPNELKRNPPSASFPDPLRKEQGSRIAGAAVGPMFDWYYGVQLVCGILAVATAFAWFSNGTVHQVRAIVLAVALVTVGIGWWLEREVSARRVTRSETSDAVLQGANPPPDMIQQADAARADFGKWHAYSLFANFATILLVLIGMALAAQLPTNGEGTNKNANIPSELELASGGREPPE